MHDELIDEPQKHQDETTPPEEAAEGSEDEDPYDPFPVSGEPQETDHTRWRQKNSDIEITD